MAAWLKPFLLALLAALCLHLVGMAGIGSQMQSAVSVLEQRADPLFTRTISAVSAPQAAAQKAATETASPLAATSAASVIEANPSKATVSVATPTPTVAETPAETATTTASTEPAAGPTVVTAATLSTLIEDTTTAGIANSPSQNITSQPTGSTDSLLVTGEWPGDTRVGYVLGGYFNGELHGNGRVQWTRSGTQKEKYQVVVEARIPGLYRINMTSQGRVSPQGLLPEAFEELVDQTGRSNRIRPLKFEATELVLGDGRRIPRPATQPMAVQDAVSQFIDLGHRFALGRDKLVTGEVIRIWLGRPGGLDEWVYDVGAAETLQLPRIGPVQVYSLTPRPLANPRGPIRIIMWLAPSLQYLPAKIRLELNDKAFIEMQAERLEQR